MAVTNIFPFEPELLPTVNDAELPDRDTIIPEFIVVLEYFKGKVF